MIFEVKDDVWTLSRKEPEMDSTKVKEKIQELLLQDFDHEFGKPQLEINENPHWQKVTQLGTRLWLDTGDIEEAEKLWSAEFSALTTNNTLLNKEIQKGIYDKQIGQAAEEIRGVEAGISEKQLILEIAFYLNAYHALQLVKRFDANVSVELHTELAEDVQASIEYGQRYYEICPQRFIIKVPLTPAGFIAAARLSRQGIPVNFTLGFSARQNYLASLLSKPAFVNVFMGRLNAFVADNDLGSGDHVGEKTTLATQRIVNELRNNGATSSNLIGASMRSGAQVSALAGLDVMTMPCKAASQFLQDPPSQLNSRLEDDPQIPLANGVSSEDFGGNTLWEVTDDFRQTVADLLEKDTEQFAPEQIQEHFKQAGFPGFLPEWSREDKETVERDGKIPVYKTWANRLKKGTVGLDALMNLSALYSFITDQKALDRRIEEQLK